MPDPIDRPALRLPYDAAPLVARPLRTERLVLRPLEASDADDVWEYQRLPEVLTYIPWPERTREEAVEHTRVRAAGRVLAVDGDALLLAMALVGEPSLVRGSRETDEPRDRVVGDVMLRVDSVRHAQLEIGWVLHPSFQGRGLAHEAARAAMEFAFRELNPHRVHALLDARNGASARLCERLGMRREATLIEEEFNDGEWQDTAVYGILQREWTSTPPWQTGEAHR